MKNLKTLMAVSLSFLVTACVSVGDNNPPMSGGIYDNPPRFSDDGGDNNFTASEDCEGQKELKVLFVGNSYTDHNDLPTLVKDLACSGGYNLSVSSKSHAGYRFLSHAGDSGTLAKIYSQAWDFVILQNQSQVPGWRPADVASESTPHAVTLADAILANNPNTQIVYYVTWGRENGDAEMCAYYSRVCTFSGHTEALLEGYTLYKDATGGILARVGTAWEAVVDDKRPPFDPGELWKADQSHPKLLGSYLAAATIYAALFNKSPLNLMVPDGISKENGIYLQKTAGSVMGVLSGRRFKPIKSVK